MSLSKKLINGFIHSELEIFMNDFENDFVPEIQDVRSLSIAWLCYYFKTSVNHENANKIILFVDNVHLKENYRTKGWYRIAALEAAAFILSSNLYYANRLIQHIDCGQSWARGFIIESAGIICPLLTFNNQFLLAATENNIKFRHHLYEENIILLLSAKGTASKKLEWLEKQIKNDVNQHSITFFNSLLSKGKFNQFGFFLKSTNKAKSYVLFKILTNSFLSEDCQNLFDELDNNFINLLKIEREHPLNDYYIDFSFLNEDNSK